MADNEELKEKYEALKLENQEGYEIVAELKHECEQKEKELKELKRQYKLSCLDCEYKNTKADVYRYRKECDFWKHQAELGSETTDRLAKQLEEKEQECEELKEKLSAANLEIENLKKELDKAYEWEQTNRATGICETCTEKANLTLDIYRDGMNKIEKLINKIKENIPLQEN